MKRLIYLPLIVLLFLGGLLAGMYLGSRPQEISRPQDHGVIDRVGNQGRGDLPGPGAALPGRALAPSPDPQGALPLAEPRRMPPKPSPKVILTPEGLEETAASLRQSGIPEEDVQGILEGARARFSPEELPPYPTLFDLTPEERVAEIKNSLKDSGIPPEDIEGIAQGFSQRIEALKQAPPRPSPMPAPAPPK